MAREPGRALDRLREAADLAGMVEEMLADAEHLSTSRLSGMRLTVRTIRETIREIHAALLASAAPAVASTRTERVRPVVQSSSSGTHAITVVRRSLRASAEKMLKH